MDARWIDGWLLDRPAYPLSLIAFEIKRAECVCPVTPVDPGALARLSLSKISHSIPVATGLKSKNGGSSERISGISIYPPAKNKHEQINN